MANHLPGTARAKGEPSKALFISMLTRDITLADCIVDLLDNSADGVKEFRKRENHAVPVAGEYKGYSVRIDFDENQFSIADNCGGIPIQVAIDYAFRFGRSDDDDDELADLHTIGLYGIGMKRAMFKMGKEIQVVSSDGNQSFQMSLNVDDWRRQRDPEDENRNDWDFPLKEVVRENTNVPIGTTIRISRLLPDTGREFSTPGFVNNLIRTLRRQYAFIISRGLELWINNQQVAPIMPTFKVAEEIAPMHDVREGVPGVRTEITAGLAAPPPEDDSAESIYPDADTYGWYIVCNDRVVVAADKTSLTGWGVRPVPNWHPQYFGFLGIVRFDADDPRLLPWTTTKRNVDSSSEVYRRALVVMSECAKQFVDYTNKRKAEVSAIRKIEVSAPGRMISEVRPRTRMMLPKVSGRKMKRIQYDKPLSEVEAVAKALKMGSLSGKEIGIRTFDYFREREVLE